MSSRNFFLRVSLLILISSIVCGRSTGGSHGGHTGGHASHPGGHTYPASTGLSGTSHGNQANTYSGSSGTSGNQAHTYPAGPGLSGNHNPSHNNYYKTEVHHHYYSPPNHITYGSVPHPVYHGSPPVYVYQYRDSGSRFDNLLAGLALYNLGKMSAHHSNRGEYGRHSGEICKFKITKRNGELEETRIDCKLMSSFIWESEKTQSTVVTKNTSTTVVNTTINGTTVTNTTVVDALEAKGPSIKVTPGMSCFLIRISRDTSRLEKKVDCGLLQEYALRSFNGAVRNLPVLSMFVCSIAYYYIH